LVRHFQFEGDFLDAFPCGNGHINDTYEVRLQRADGLPRRYILQRINHHVFRDPPGLMHNIEAVTSHLRKKVVGAGGDPERETLNLIPTVDGETLHTTPDGDYWRAYVFIEGAQTYEVVQGPEFVYNAAQAFGKFQRLVGDFPARQLHETIPGFHDTGARFQAFIESVERDARNRAQSAAAEIQFAEARAEHTSVLVDLLEQGDLPQRLTHNDTKFNNVMFDNETGKGVCVIDLDTVMPGLSLYDFGDAVRSGANTAAEDERDLSKVSFDLGVFEQYLHGYLDSADDFLTPLEVAHLPFAARLMTFECGLRFLTDYLDGDVYFKTDRPRHNLDRCRTQFKMLHDMERDFDQMEKILEGYWGLEIELGT
jgi:Ser/Thr protein kinase RdoA (MazF antagonist)